MEHYQERLGGIWDIGETYKEILGEIVENYKEPLGEIGEIGETYQETLGEIEDNFLGEI